MSMEFFRKTLDILTQVSESSPPGGERVSVRREHYSWGDMVVIEVGHSFSIPLHPEHMEAIAAMKDGGYDVFRVETGDEIGVKREGDKIHFTAGRGMNVTVDRSELIDEQSDELSGDKLESYDKKVSQPIYEGTWSLPDTPEKQQQLAKILSQPLGAESASRVLYRYLGNDDLFDRLADEAEFYGRENIPVERQDVRDLVVGWLKRNADQFPEYGEVLELIGESMNEGDDVMAYTGPSEYETNPYTAREVLQQAREWIEGGEDFDTVREIINAMIDDGAVSASDAKKVLSKIWNEQQMSEAPQIGQFESHLDELSTGMHHRYKDRAEQELRGMSRDMRSGKDVDDTRMNKRERGLERAARLEISEVLTPQQRQTMTTAAPGVAQAQTDPRQAAAALKQTANVAQSAASNADAATAGLNQAGQKIDQLQQQQAPAPKKPAGPMYAAKPGDGQYVIKRGETLSGIAKANGITLQDLLKANPNIKDPNRVAAGAGLNLPQKAAPTTTDTTAQVNPTVGNPQVNRPMTQAEFDKLRIPKTAQAVPQQAAPQQQGAIAQAGSAIQNWWNNRGQRVQAANQEVQQKLAQQGTQMQQQQNARAGVTAESITIGSIVKIETAPGTLSRARVKAINEGQYTVATRSGTEYTVGYDALWVKTRKLTESVDLDAWAQEYDENEEYNNHTENVLLVAELVGSPDDVAQVKKILQLRDRQGYLTSEQATAGYEIQSRLWPKVKQLFTQQHAGKTMHESWDDEEDDDVRRADDELRKMDVKLPKVRDRSDRDMERIRREKGDEELDEGSAKTKDWYEKLGRAQSDKFRLDNKNPKKFGREVAKMSRAKQQKDILGLDEADLVGLGEKTRSAKMPRGPVVEAIELDSDTIQRITADYNGFRKMKTSDLLRLHRSRSRLENNYSAQDAGGKQGMIATLLRDKFGDKRMDAYWALPAKARNAPVVEGETCCTVKYKMQKSDPKISVAEYDSREAAERFLASIKAKGGNGIISDKKKIDELSKDTLTSYIKKASKGAQDFSDVPDERKAGVTTALKKKHDMGARVPATDNLSEKVDLSESPRQSMGGALRNELSKAEPGSKLDKQIKHHNAMVRQFGRGTMDKAPSGYRFDNKGLIRLGVNEKVDLGEKAVSKKQQKFMGMVHAAQKGEKPASKKVADVAKSMKKSDVKDFAKTKHKGLPQKADECTTSGGVAVAAAPMRYKNEASMKPVKDGVYEARNEKFERLIAESMNISVNLGTDPTGKPNKSITINATDDDAEQLSRLLNLAGIDGMTQNQPEVAIAIPADDCGCEEMLDENEPDWPTNQETSNDPFQYSGGLNKPKVTGQTTGAPVNVSPARGAFNENVELERTLFKLYNRYSGE